MDRIRFTAKLFESITGCGLALRRDAGATYEDFFEDGPIPSLIARSGASLQDFKSNLSLRSRWHEAVFYEKQIPSGLKA